MINNKGTDRREFIKNSITIAVSTAVVVSGMDSVFAQTQAVDLFGQINRARDVSKLQGLELGHVPQIRVPESIQAGMPFEAEIKVGEKLHEMIPSHYIDWVDIYADDIFLAKFILTPNFTQPVCKLVLTLNKTITLRATEHCNLHGLWEGTKLMTVM